MFPYNHKQNFLKSFIQTPPNFFESKLENSPTYITFFPYSCKLLGHIIEDTTKTPLKFRIDIIFELHSPCIDISKKVNIENHNFFRKL